MGDLSHHGSGWDRSALRYVLTPHLLRRNQGPCAEVSARLGPRLRPGGQPQGRPRRPDVPVRGLLAPERLLAVASESESSGAAAGDGLFPRVRPRLIHLRRSRALFLSDM